MCSRNITDTIANVICRELGYQYAVEWVDLPAGLPWQHFLRDNVVLSDIQCSSNISQLKDCTYTVGNRLPCSAWYDHVRQGSGTYDRIFKEEILAVVCKPLPG